MGIIRFKSVINKYEKIKFKGNLENIVSLFIDCNGIFHEAKGHVYKTAMNSKTRLPVYTDKERERVKKSDPKELEKKHIKMIIEKFESILRKFKPTGTLILAPDGMAPSAKMQQQKERRYSKNSPEGEMFLGGTISPGTDFMMKLDVAIRKWLAKENELFPEKIIYSSHLCPGEGEHKIFDFIRSRSLASSRGRHVIYGADGDLYIISFFSPLRNIYLFDENNEEFYNIEKLKKEIAKDMRYPSYKGGDDAVQLIRDFCFLTFLIGNDFIHRLPNLYDTKLSMEILMDLYKEHGKDLTTNRHKIIWKNLLSFFKLLKDFKIDDMNMYVFSAFSSFTPLHNTGWVTYPEIREAITITDTKGKELGDVNYNPKNHLLDFDLKKFARAWYEKQFKPKSETMIKIYDGEQFFNRSDIEKMCKFYLKILQWALYYYNLGDTRVSKFLFYPFFYTPLLENLIVYLENNEPHNFTGGILDDGEYELTVIHQLMLILPPSNKMLIPSPFRELYLSKLASISPEDYITIPQEGSDVGFHNTKIIPPINPFLVKKVINMSKEKIPIEYQHQSATVYLKKQKEIKKKGDYTISQENLL